MNLRANLYGFIDEHLLANCFDELNKKGAPGVDGQTWESYNDQRDERIPQLLEEFKSGSYRAPNIRRTWIPKGDGTRRPLGLPTVEDKLLQSAVTKVLNPVYEQLFYPTSYGFRRGKSQHQALEVLFKQVSFNGMRYVIDADIAGYFDNIDHGWLREFLARRIKDGVIRRQIDKWLKAGVLKDGQVSYPSEGTPQGGVISPLLSNIYLHYVLDEWFTERIQPRLKSNSGIVRFADDFLLMFSNKSDAKRVMKVLDKRLGKFGLTLNSEKTSLIELNTRGGNKPDTFDFLGFTHSMGKSRKGKWILKRKTSSKKMRMSLQRINEWLKANRHKPVGMLISLLNQKLRGHYGYYGITFNSRSLTTYHHRVRHCLHKWINRRGGKRVWTWEKYTKLLLNQMPLEKPRIVHSQILANP